MLASTLLLVVSILVSKKTKKDHRSVNALSTKRSYDAWERSRGFRYSSK